MRLGDALPADGRFLCGDTLTIYDFTVAGLLTNLIRNPSARDKQLWDEIWKCHAPERVKKYYDDFCKEMKEYLEQRDDTIAM